MSSCRCHLPVCVVHSHAHVCVSRTLQVVGAGAVPQPGNHRCETANGPHPLSLSPFHAVVVVVYFGFPSCHLQIIPRYGPLNGRISVTIKGSNMGIKKEDIKTITVAGVDCVHQEDKYSVSTR